MLAVDTGLRGKGIGNCLICKAIRSLRQEACEEVVLETECSNAGALRLYEGLGFFRDKRLLRYYLNGGDAFRLKLWFPGVAYFYS
jgi:peptide alpha-N-acetyltransferase